MIRKRGLSVDDKEVKVSRTKERMALESMNVLGTRVFGIRSGAHVSD